MTESDSTVWLYIFIALAYLVLCYVASLAGYKDYKRIFGYTEELEDLPEEES